MSNPTHTVFYTGMTDDLIFRVGTHKSKTVPGFTSRYNVTKLVYYEIGQDVTEIIIREKQIKGGSRKKKIALITKMNPEWKDLYDELVKG